MNQITNTKSTTNQKLVPTHQALKSRILSLFIAYSHPQTNKRGLSADSLSLFLSALRPRLLLPLKMPKFGQNSRKIVILLAIFSIFSVFFVKNTPVSAASLTLSVPSSLSLNISPSTNPSGFFAKSPTPGKISISTDNSSGYTLSIKAKNSENSNSLLNGTHQLTSISSSLSEDQYKTSGNLNTWGYLPDKLDGVANTNFIPGPTVEGSTLDTTESANTESNDYNLMLAAKVDSSIPAGSYTNTFIISALANAPKYDDTMQNWAANTDNCANLPDGQILNLQDTRDESIYRVAKLADDRCWMIDNLRIVGKKVTSADSDVTADFTIPPSDITKFTITSSDNHDAAYYEKNNKDESGDDYGAYYNWHTATAGTGVYVAISGDVPSSICPKGWHLPKGGSSGDFVALDKAMGGTGSSRTDAAARDRFIHKPIPGFTYNTGYIYGELRYGEGKSYYWSSTAAGRDSAYYLYFSRSGELYPQNGDAKFVGRSVRCIADEPEPSPELLTQLYISSTDTVTVQPGTGIELIMIADGNDRYKPYYATQDTPVTLPSASGRKYVLTVIPSPGNVMTNLTKGADGTITATGAKGSYPSMQDFNSCTAEGNNVTDIRNNISYTVAKIGNKCWMLSNLRLAAGTTLTSADSNVSSNFTTPTDAWSGEYSISRMKECHGIVGNSSTDSDCDQSGPVTEYYYNWTAAKANATSTSYSICPKNWTLPNYSNDITTSNVWNSTNNPGRLATVGLFGVSGGGSQRSVGNEASWQSSTRDSGSPYVYYLYFGGSYVGRYLDEDYMRASNYGYSVRCMR